MEETVNGPMLVAKRADFQKAFNGLEDERLPSEDWIASFCKAYKIKNKSKPELQPFSNNISLRTASTLMKQGCLHLHLQTMGKV
ncbi:hypothetical protein EMCRGX_G031911 [Ephydatia muelleri]